jgi:threonine dehydrogenase-like Zn-dependent dehydrogenase
MTSTGMTAGGSNPYRAAEWTGTGFVIGQFPVEAPGPGEARVRVTACSVCLTEVHYIDGYYDELDAPARLGHEYAGIVEAVGPGVAGLDPGGLVAGFGAFGGFGEVLVTAADLLLPLPAGLAPDVACLLEPVSCCVLAVRQGRITPGATVLVTGAGSNGLLIVQLARTFGAGRVIVSEPDDRRRALARDLGADEVLDPAAAPLAEVLRDTAVEVAFESAGSVAAVRDCLGAVDAGGRVVLFGVHRDSAELPVPLYQFHFRNLSLIGSFGADLDAARQAAALLPGLALKPLISHRFGLDDIGRAFDAARSGTGLKVIVYPGSPGSG